MTAVADKVKEQFDSLPDELKIYIMERNVTINDMTDLMKVLQNIADEGEDKMRP